MNSGLKQFNRNLQIYFKPTFFTEMFQGFSTSYRSYFYRILVINLLAAEVFYAFLRLPQFIFRKTYRNYWDIEGQGISYFNSRIVSFCFTANEQTDISLKNKK